MESFDLKGTISIKVSPLMIERHKKENPRQIGGFNLYINAMASALSLPTMKNMNQQLQLNGYCFYYKNCDVAEDGIITVNFTIDKRK